MALKRLMTAEMVQISGPWTTNGSPSRKGIQSVPVMAGVLPMVDGAHKQLLAIRPVQEDPRVAEISAETAEIDARHDVLVRGTDHMLQGAALLAGDSPRAREIEAARAVLTPDGLALVSTSYRNEAGAAALLESRLRSEPGVKAVLASIVVDKKKTLTSFVNERIELAHKLGELEDERAQLLSAPVESDGGALVDARNAWIRAVNALVANAELAELTPEQRAVIFGALDQAEAKADRRGRAAPAEPTAGPADPGATDPSAKGSGSRGSGDVVTSAT